MKISLNFGDIVIIRIKLGYVIIDCIDFFYLLLFLNMEKKDFNIEYFMFFNYLFICIIFKG